MITVDSDSKSVNAHQPLLLAVFDEVCFMVQSFQLVVSGPKYAAPVKDGCVASKLGTTRIRGV